MMRRVLITLLVLLVGTLYFTIQSSKWNKNAVFVFDVSLYYTYLPALFIYDDIKMEKSWDYDISPHHVSHFPEQPLNRPLKVTYGVSVFYAPFFLIAHALSEPLGYESTGYSPIYAMAIVMSSVFWLFVGLWFLSKFLIRRTSQTSIILTIITLYVGTNLLYYTVYRSPMSHVYSFTLISILLYLFDPKYTKRKWLFWGGLLVGLAVVVRPINGLLVLPIGLYWLWERRNDLNIKKEVVPAIVGGIVPIIPQLLYWKSLTGTWLYNPYIGEGFFGPTPRSSKGSLAGDRDGYCTLL